MVVATAVRKLLAEFGFDDEEPVVLLSRSCADVLIHLVVVIERFRMAEDVLMLLL